MTKMIIADGMVIDDTESVLQGIRNLSGMDISSLEVIKKFITGEKNTVFYIDKKLNSYMQKQSECVYAWLDSGYTDYNGKPIMISLLQSANGFCGHIVGTVDFLSENAKNFFNLSNKIVNSKKQSILKKYNAKADERRVRHILDERSYILDSIHQIDGESVTELGAKLAALDIVFDEPEKENNQVEEPMEETNIDSTDEEFTKFEEELTIGLLLEQMEKMQSHMDELLIRLEKVSSESQEKIDELQKKNDEYRTAIMKMRDFSGNNEETDELEQDKSKEMTGHKLLGSHGKILVIGGMDIGANIVHGIAKTMGFEKRDFDFVDYDKTKDYADRIRRNGKYRAVIFGACPHKTTAGYGYSSFIEKIKQIKDMPYASDARSKSGKLKVTKESFRNALLDVHENLRLSYAC